MADGAANIFLQPLDGREPVQLTKCDRGFIASYDWTADGKLVISRGEMRTEIILISDFR